MLSHLTRTLRRVAAGALCAAAVALPLQYAGTALATTTTTASTPLTLQNGWTSGPFDTAKPSVRTTSGIVTFKGEIRTSGTDPVAFTLPQAFRPVSDVWVPVTLCSAANGRLYIQPDGMVTVQVENAWSAAQCMTSLDGVSFAKSGGSFTPLRLEYGWTNSAYGAGKVGARLISGIVHLRGGILNPSASASPLITFLPKALRPAKRLYVKADLCNAQNGHLIIFPDGVVEVAAENSFSEATCFTSFDGVSFAKSGASFTNLALKNGWGNSSLPTARAAVRNISGVVTLRGAVATNGAFLPLFVLPKSDRPASPTLVPVDCPARTTDGWTSSPTGS
jgi:hypothetical protein